MCGIAGIAHLRGGPAPDPARVRAMCAAMIHRGPDDEGVGAADGVALGMRRLSIIDLAGGHQPMANEDGRVRVVFNGEIYNFAELRAELASAGHRFATRSDTEVLVHGYEEWGDAFLERLNGMFALALHDRARRRLLLARDPIGVKPLYWAVVGDELRWGSEVKVVLAGGPTPRELDPDALNEFLSWEYVPGEGTLLKAVRKLEAGVCLIADLAGGEIRRKTYWDAPPAEPAPARTPAEWADAVDAALAAAVRRQLVSDVPLGAFLSGGVDSSLMTAAMGPARTFSIGFADPSYNELAWSERVARHLGLSHTTERLQPDIVDLFFRLMPHLDDPIGDFSIFPTYLVSRLARRSVTVALGGDGGDELFAGYETYAADALARHWFDRWPAAARQRALPRLLAGVRPRAKKKGLVNKGKRFLEGLAHDPALGHARWRLFLTEAQRAALFTPEVRRAWTRPFDAHIRALFERAGPRDPLARSLYVDLKSYLCDDILTKVDRMSMAVSLEARVPYLDLDFVALAFRVPSPLKLRGGRTKALLKEVAARHVPRECVYRPKEGFSIPIKQWLATTLRPLLEETLSEERLRRRGLFQPEFVATLKAQHLAGTHNHSHLLWSLIVFETWADAVLKPR